MIRYRRPRWASIKRGDGVTDATGQASAANQVLIVQETLTLGFSGTISAGGVTFTPASNGSGLG